MQGGFEGRGDLHSYIEHRQLWHKAVAFDPMVETSAIGEFHDDVGAALMFVEGIDMKNIGVIERGCGAGFAEEAFHHLFVLGHLALEHLHGDEPMEAGVEGAIDRAHAAGRDDFAQLELPDVRGEDDGMPALAARRGGESGMLLAEPLLGLALTASGHSEGLPFGMGCFRHRPKIAVVAPATRDEVLKKCDASRRRPAGRTNTRPRRCPAARRRARSNCADADRPRQDFQWPIRASRAVRDACRVNRHCSGTSIRSPSRR